MNSMKPPRPRRASRAKRKSSPSSGSSWRRTSAKGTPAPLLRARAEGGRSPDRMRRAGSGAQRLRRVAQGRVRAELTPRARPSHRRSGKAPARHAPRTRCCRSQLRRARADVPLASAHPRARRGCRKAEADTPLADASEVPHEPLAEGIAASFVRYGPSAVSFFPKGDGGTGKAHIARRSGWPASGPNTTTHRNPSLPRKEPLS